MLSLEDVKEKAGRLKGMLEAREKAQREHEEAKKKWPENAERTFDQLLEEFDEASLYGILGLQPPSRDGLDVRFSRIANGIGILVMRFTLREDGTAFLYGKSPSQVLDTVVDELFRLAIEGERE